MKNKIRYVKIGVIVFSIALLLVLIPAFGNGSYLTYMIPLWAILFFFMTRAGIKMGTFLLIPLIITAAFIYVLYCNDCTALKKSIISTLWLSYMSAMFSGSGRQGL